jgi:ATP-dependent RNA helicase DDX54/DBP10
MGKNKSNNGKSSGGFQSMEISKDIFKGIMRLGYKVPTPIQRKALPLGLQGKDIVAMARTGKNVSILNESVYIPAQI